MMPSWSSESCNSAAEHSMPRLSTPRMVPTPSVMFLPGMKVPGGENTLTRPARAFGAPQTTCTGAAPLPGSTMQTRKRSALGCCSAEITRAMVNGASALALSSMFSTSSPIMVSLSASFSSGSSVSRWSFSQERVNFMFFASPRAATLFPSRACWGGSGWGLSPQRQSRHARIQPRRCSRAQSSRQRRDVERLEAVVAQPAHVAFEQLPQVGHAVFQHRDAVDAHAPGKALIDVGIDAAGAQHIGVHHAAAENLHPVLAFAETNLALVAPALDVDLERGFGERKERRAESHVDVIDLEERLAEFVQDPFEVAKMRAFVDDEALDLVKLRRMGRVGIDTVGAAGADDADRRLLCEHGAHLHRRGVGAQQHARAILLRVEEKRVVHLPRRVAFGKIQFGEIVVVGLDIRAFGDRKSHIGEDRVDLLEDLAERMNAALFSWRFADGQRDVDGLGGKPCVKSRGFQDIAARRQRQRDVVSGEVDRSTLRLALVRRHLAERCQ